MLFQCLCGFELVCHFTQADDEPKYTMKSAIKEINRRLLSRGITFEMNQYVFNLFNRVYGIKENEKFCYVHRQYAQPSYTYSIQAVDLIVGEIEKHPDDMVEYLKKAKK